MASILRHRRNHNFTILPNELIRDDRLSYRARGVLAYLLALPDGSHFDSRILSERGKEGRDAIRSVFRELEAAGYMRLTRQQDVQGRWSSTTEVTDEPTSDWESGPGESTEPRTDYPTPVDPALNNQELTSTSTNNSLETETSIEVTADLGLGFDEFWFAYPRKVDKGHAEKAWAKAVREGASPEDIVHGCCLYAKVRDGQDPKFTAYPATWLNGKRWTDEPDPEHVSSTMSVLQRFASET